MYSCSTVHQFLMSTWSVTALHRPVDATRHSTCFAQCSWCADNGITLM